MQEKKQKRYVGVKETLIYGIANGGQCIGYNLIRQQLMIYLPVAFGIDYAYVSLMMTIMAFWDAFNDPIMGAVVDKTRTRYGKLRPYLVFVPIPLGITTILFFSGATFLRGSSDMVKVVYMYITYFAWEFFYTIGDIPFWGLSAAISPNPLDRSRVIKSARLISGIIGGIPGIIVTVCLDLTKNDYQKAVVFMILGIVAGTVGMFLFSLSGLMTKERMIQSNDEPSIIDCFKLMFRNKNLLLIVLSSIIGTLEGFGSAFTSIYYKSCLGIASLSLVAGIPGTITSFLTFGIMTPLEKKFSSKRILYGNSFLKFAVSGIIFLIGLKNYTNSGLIVPLLAIYGIFTSFSGSINAVIPTKMISETVDYMEWKTGERSEGMAFSLLTFISKLTGSLSTALSFAVAPLIGLRQMGENFEIPEDGEINTKLWLWGFMTIVPTTLGLLSLIPYKFYDLEGEKLQRIQEDLRRKREEMALKVS